MCFAAVDEASWWRRRRAAVALQLVEDQFVGHPASRRSVLPRGPVETVVRIGTQATSATSEVFVGQSA